MQVSGNWTRDRLGCPVDIKSCPVDIQTRAAQNSLLCPCIAPALSGPPLRSPLCRSFWIWAWLYSANPSRASTTLQAREGHAGCGYELQGSASSKAAAAGTPFNASASCTASTLHALTRPHTVCLSGRKVTARGATKSQSAPQRHLQRELFALAQQCCGKDQQRNDFDLACGERANRSGNAHTDEEPRCFSAWWHPPMWHSSGSRRRGRQWSCPGPASPTHPAQWWSQLTPFLSSGCASAHEGRGGQQVP